MLENLLGMVNMQPRHGSDMACGWRPANGNRPLGRFPMEVALARPSHPARCRWPAGDPRDV